MSKVGNAVPSVDFKYRVRTDGFPITHVDNTNGDANPFDWKTVNSNEIFEGKKVVVFSLPGAFTPTCSTYQVPGFEKMYNEFKAKGIDDIYVVSVKVNHFLHKLIKVFKILNLFQTALASLLRKWVCLYAKII